MSEDKIDKLYKNYDILSAATDKSEVSFFRVFVVISINWQPRDIKNDLFVIKLLFQREWLELFKLNKQFHSFLIFSNLKRNFYIFSFFSCGFTAQSRIPGNFGRGSWVR